VLVRRRIQTPSDAKVLSVVQPEGEVVLGASPPARPTAEDPLRPGGRTMTIFGGTEPQ
jgi:hypothetical protein